MFEGIGSKSNNEAGSRFSKGAAYYKKELLSRLKKL